MMSPQLTFDEKDHCYRYGGVVVPSVTQILEDDGQLVPSYPSGPYKTRGSRVHRATELWDNGELSKYEVGSEIAPYVRSYASLVLDLTEREPGKWDWMPGGIERRMAHYTGFAGTTDRLGLRPLVADLKSGKTGRETGVQLAGYVILALADPEVKKHWGTVRETDVERVKFELQKDGEMAKMTFYSDPLDFDVFRGLLAKFVWKRKK